MAVFSYQARDARGNLVSGVVNAESIHDASRSLRNDGKYVLDVTPGIRREDESLIESLKISEAARRVKREEVIDLCHQLSVMLEAGVPLSQALEAFNSNARGGDFRRVTSIVADEVNNGASLSSAMSRWPRAFPTLLLSLVEASEASGTMAMMLGRVSTYLGKELKTVRQIRGALTYPCVMMVMALGVTVFLMTGVLPRFAAIYANRSAALPGPTKIMLAISGTFQQHWQIMMISLIVLAITLTLALRQPFGRRILDWLKLNLPILGPMYTKLYITRSSRTMATLLAAGVDMLETIRITRGVTPNVYYQDMWNDVTTSLEQGKQLSVALREGELMPGNIVQMIAAGEYSGKLGKVLERIGEVAEDELDEAVSKTTQFIEPAMITIMGVVIGFVSIAMLLPIFTISKALH